MEKIRLGLQTHAVREAFDADPVKTIHRIAQMGYEGVELNCWTIREDPQFYLDALKDAGLECFSCMATWEQLKRENLQNTVRLCKGLGIRDMILGSVEAEPLKNDPAYPLQAITYMNELRDRLAQAGIRTGYHSHDMDSIRTMPGKSFYEQVMENTPEDFCMVVDTGNTMAGGDDPVALLRQFPGRSPILHIKGYSQKKGYLTPVWESDADSTQLLNTAIDLGGTRIMVIEFGTRGDYEPFERAEKSLVWLKKTLEKLGRQ